MKEPDSQSPFSYLSNVYYYFYRVAEVLFSWQQSGEKKTQMLTSLLNSSLSLYPAQKVKCRIMNI